MKATNLFMVVLGLYLLASAITAIVLMVKANSSVENDATLYNDIKDNFKTPTLEAVTLSFEPCVAPFTPLFTIHIEGTKAYCSCFGSFYYKNLCPSRSYTCNQISARPGFDVYSFKGIYFCGLRSIYNYDRLPLADEGKCPPNYQICGKDSEKELCYPASSPCPVNDFVVSDEARVDLETQGYNRVWLNSGSIVNPDGSILKPRHPSSQYQSGNFFLYYTNKRVDKPLVIDFKLGYGSICANPKEERAPIEQHDLLDKEYHFECKHSVGGFKDNPHYKQVATANKKALWRDNSVFLELGALPNFSQHSIDYEIGLFYRSYIHFGSTCIDKVNTKEETKYDKASFMERLATGSNASTYGYMIAICVLAGIFGCCSCLFSIISASDKTKKSESIPLMHCVCLFLVVVTVLVAVLLFKQLPAYSLMKTIKGEDCGDKMVNALTSGESSSSSKVSAYYTIILSLLGVGMIGYLVLLCLKDSPGERGNEYAELAEHQPAGIDGHRTVIAVNAENN